MRRHSYASGALPVAATLKVAACPATALTAAGCVVIAGAGFTLVSVAGAEIAWPATLETATK